MKTFYTIRVNDTELRSKYNNADKAIAEIKEWQKYPENKRKTFHIMKLYGAVRGNIIYRAEYMP